MLTVIEHGPPIFDLPAFESGFLVDVDGNPHIVLRPAIEALGLNYARQYRKVKCRSWASVGSAKAVGADGRSRTMVTVDLPTFLMLLATVDESRVSDEVRLALISCQMEITSLISAAHTDRTRTSVLPAERPSLDPERLRRVHEGWVYVVEFSSGIVKVGRTKRLQKRLDHHSQAARSHGQHISRFWISPRHAAYSASEQELIGFCAGRWSLASGREYFADADYEEIIRFAESRTNVRDLYEVDAAATQLELGAAS